MSSMGKIFIFVDDIRNVDYSLVPDGMVIVVSKTYKSAIQELEKYVAARAKIMISLDHDLGCKKFGYYIAKWIVNSGYQNVRFHVHSANVVGRTNIRQLLLHYGYEEF